MSVRFLFRSVMLGMGHRRRVQPCLFLRVLDSFVATVGEMARSSGVSSGVVRVRGP